MQILKDKEFSQRRKAKMVCPAGYTECTRAWRRETDRQTLRNDKSSKALCLQVSPDYEQRHHLRAC